MVRSNIMDNTNVKKVIDTKGCFSVMEWQRDISVGPASAQTAYFMSQMGCRKRQVVANLNNNGIILQAGAMQVILGNVNMNTNVKGAGDLFKKMIGSKVTGETAIKPRYVGTGQVILEPTYKYLLLVDLNEWNGGITIEDGYS